MMRFAPLAAITLVACGNAQPDHSLPATEAVARNFMAHPQQPAPNPQAAREFKFLDECTVRLIRGSDITYETPPHELNQKIQGFMQRCVDEKDALLARGELRK